MVTEEIMRKAGMPPTLNTLFLQQVVRNPSRIALTDGSRVWTYRELNIRVNRLANALTGIGITRGDRVAIVSENRPEFVELQLACAKIGAIAACQNWRQTKEELAHCLDLVSPAVILVSERYLSLIEGAARAALPRVVLGAAYEDWISTVSQDEPGIVVDPEDGLLILYTSGTTGLPKGALISHRAMVARGVSMFIEWNLSSDDSFVAWAPLFHMASADLTLATLSYGGKVRTIDGFDVDNLLDAIESEKISWLPLMPGMIGRTIEALKEKRTVPRGIKLIGCMANLVPPAQIQEISHLLDSGFLNSLGSTETGIAPASKSLIPAGVAPVNFNKVQTCMCEVRLVNADGMEAMVGEPGEMTLRSPMLFSGYWNAPEVNATDFRGGWFHMGDIFKRNQDGTLEYLDRKKYLIKSGGENIYPAEIERILLACPRIQEAVVVRKPDPVWGEIPVVFVVARDPALTGTEVLDLCRGKIAGYKLPKSVHFIQNDDLPRSETGKIKREMLEKLLIPAAMQEIK